MGKEKLDRKCPIYSELGDVGRVLDPGNSQRTSPRLPAPQQPSPSWAPGLQSLKRGPEPVGFTASDAPAGPSLAVLVRLLFPPASQAHGSLWVSGELCPGRVGLTQPEAPRSLALGSDGSTSARPRTNSSPFPKRKAKSLPQAPRNLMALPLASGDR